MSKFRYALGTAAVLLLAGCGGNDANDRAADAMETQAAAVRDAGEATADAIESQAANLDRTTDGMDTAAENAGEARAQAVREKTEAKADAIENKADAVRDGKTPPR